MYGAEEQQVVADEQIRPLRTASSTVSIVGSAAKTIDETSCVRSPTISPGWSQSSA